jgi:hypothetical protein
MAVVAASEVAGNGDDERWRQRRSSGVGGFGVREHGERRVRYRSNERTKPRRTGVAPDQKVAGKVAGVELWRQRARVVDGNVAGACSSSIQRASRELRAAASAKDMVSRPLDHWRLVGGELHGGELGHSRNDVYGKPERENRVGEELRLTVRLRQTRDRLVAAA